MDDAKDAPKILILGNPLSIHTIRWVSQLKSASFHVSLFSPVPPDWNNWHSDQYSMALREIEEKLNPISLINLKRNYFLRFIYHCQIQFRYYLSKIKIDAQWIDKILNYYLQRKWQRKLIQLVCFSNFRVIHSLGLNQNWRNLCRPILKIKSAHIFTIPWIYSSWGTDLSFYPMLSPENELDVRSVISEVDGLIVESEYDHQNAIAFGLKGKFLGILPAFGGFDLDRMNTFRSEKCPSERKKIFIKGRGKEDPVGRAMVILDALEQIKSELDGYEIIIGQATQTIRERAVDLARDFGLNFTILPFLEDADEILKYIGQSRIFISITVNDGLPASLIEAMALGTFPIFSDLPSLAEWIDSNKNGVC